MRSVLFTLVCCLAAQITSTRLARGVELPNAAVFAGGNIIFNGFNDVIGAPVIANGNVMHNGGSLNVDSIFAAGAFTRTGASFQNSIGDILFGGNIVDIGGPGSVIGGNLISGGNITFQITSTTVAGDVIAAGSVSQPFSFAEIQGSVLAGGNVNIQGTVQGDVKYGGTLTQGTFATINGATTHGGPVVPPAYAPITLPAGRDLTPGVNNITLSNFQDISLLPGTYGNLVFASGNTVSLSAGQYVFADISNSFSLNHLSFDTSGGPINLYVDDDFDFNLVQDVNGEPLFVGGNPDPNNAFDIFMEVAGSFTSSTDIYGTVFAPNGDITLNSFSEVTGRLFAGRDVIMNSSSVTVPEPASLAMLAIGGMLLLLHATRRRWVAMAWKGDASDRVPRALPISIYTNPICFTAGKQVAAARRRSVIV